MFVLLSTRTGHIPIAAIYASCSEPIQVPRIRLVSIYIVLVVVRSLPGLLLHFDQVLSLVRCKFYIDFIDSLISFWWQVLCAASRLMKCNCRLLYLWRRCLDLNFTIIFSYGWIVEDWASSACLWIVSKKIKRKGLPDKVLFWWLAMGWEIERLRVLDGSIVVSGNNYLFFLIIVGIRIFLGIWDLIWRYRGFPQEDTAQFAYINNPSILWVWCLSHRFIKILLLSC